MSETLLKVHRLCQYFKVGKKQFKAVDDVSFEIKKGEIFSLVGESGSGKTTTGRSIVGLYDLTDGEIFFKGERVGAGTQNYIEKERFSRLETAKTITEWRREMRAYPERKIEVREKIQTKKDELRRSKQRLKEEIHRAKFDTVRAKKQKSTTGIQMIFQDPIASLNPRMTVGEIIAEGLIVRGVKDKKYIREQVAKTLQMVGLLPEYASRYPHEFSGGQRQRIGIARAVIMNPEMIIADEPVSALDVSVQAQVINLLSDLRKEMGLTVLFIAHDLSVVKYFSDTIAVMYAGKIVEIASADELFLSPLHPYTKSLLSAIPLPDPVYEKKRKRIIYAPTEENEKMEKERVLTEVSNGHFVRCTQDELKEFQRKNARKK